MKCDHCGANIGLEDKVCPYCGKINPYAQQHQQQMQHYQQQFIHSLSAMSDNLRMVNLQAMLLAVKEMAGWTLWICLAIVAILLIIPWPKRRLKPAEIPEDFNN